ncbi:3'-5' exonuclease [Dictyobacter formicarum]|uniref:Exonuclease domain-containing protein n=1 Tax=Dictyobacter formicarum TaxID=2778368 RepID=A0ABQ3VIR8_9CHLR|nr:hypothetical protein [Dictyobacter formicarum]GHO85584.1 hypothetical protein KSZ_35900 [Dictyobacter formicarum]
MMTNALIPQTLSDLLAQERGLGPVRHMDDLQARLQRRSAIARQIQQWEEALRLVQKQSRMLTPLPPLKVIHWARAVQAMPNLVFLEVDTTGLHEDAEIVRLVVLNLREETLLDCLVTPTQQLSRQMVTITGITNVEIKAKGVPVAQALAQLRRVIHGAYVLSYNLEFDVSKLRESVHRHHLDEITIIGEDLMERAMSYLHLSSYPKLEGLCQQLGQPLPPQPHQTALDRARGQIAVLNAIADVAFASPASSALQATDPDHEVADDRSL